MKKITILLLSLMCLKMSAQITTRSGSLHPSLPVLPQPRTRPNPPAILARREARPSRVLRPARPPRSHTEQRIGKHQPARPRAGAISYEGHYGGWEDLFGQGGEGIKINNKAENICLKRFYSFICSGLNT